MSLANGTVAFGWLATVQPCSHHWQRVFKLTIFQQRDLYSTANPKKTTCFDPRRIDDAQSVKKAPSCRVLSNRLVEPLYRPTPSTDDTSVENLIGGSVKRTTTATKLYPDTVIL